MKRHEHDVLIINSYAGSLTLAAHSLNLKVRGSYEDAGYGLPIQEANFPNLNYIAKSADWPAQDLSRTIVIAHPPCAAFSVQNARHKKNKDAYGADAKKFQCTKVVLEYALKNKCAALAIESVPGALEGARAVHDEYAAQYGYHAFRILQNAISFNVPQWRPRFWIIFLPSKTNDFLSVGMTPQYATISDILDKRVRSCDIVQDIQDGLVEQKKKLVKMGFSRSTVRGIFDGEYGFGPLQRILMRSFEISSWDEANTYCVFGVSFATDSTIVLSPEWYSNTLLCQSRWTIMNRAVTAREFKRVMGFPEGYKFPGKANKKGFRCYLSRGVCPPVAAWILKTVRFALRDADELPGDLRAVLAPGEIADLNIKKRSEKDRKQLDLFPEEVAYI